MDCLTCRESLSARIDGETEALPAEKVDAHLLGCAPCRTWRRRVDELNRALRVRRAEAGPDLTEAILAATPHTPSQGWSTRGALLGVAVAQVALGLSQLVGAGSAAHTGHATAPTVAPTMATHLFNESTAWNLALGIGMLWAAFRPRATSGVVPVLAGFVVVLFAYSAHDLVVGSVPVTRVLGHGLLVAGLVLMIVVNRRHRPSSPDTSGMPRPVASEAQDRSTTDRAAAEATERPRLLPASRHRAA